LSRADRGVIGGATLSQRAQEGVAASFDHQPEDAIKRWSMHAFGTQFAEACVDIDADADRTPARGSRLAGRDAT
jgi:hypothetical protein